MEINSKYVESEESRNKRTKMLMKEQFLSVYVVSIDGQLLDISHSSSTGAKPCFHPITRKIVCSCN